jgi:hypothetical protein
MAITQVRLGFFNARLEQRMAEMGLPAPELARRVGVTYEHVRKLLMGQCLPSDSMLERLLRRTWAKPKGNEQSGAKRQNDFSVRRCSMASCRNRPKGWSLLHLAPLADPRSTRASACADEGGGRGEANARKIVSRSNVFWQHVEDMEGWIGE